MNQKDFSELKVGDSVTLAVDHISYDYPAVKYYERDKVVVKAGTVGIVGAVKVPPVRGNRAYFHCIDFPWNSTEFGRSKPEHRNKIRCGVYAEDLI